MSLRPSSVPPPAAPAAPPHAHITSDPGGLAPIDPTAPAPITPGLTPPPNRGRSSALIGELITSRGYADRSAVDGAVRHARACGRMTGEVLVERGVLTPDQLARIVAEKFGLHHVDLSVYPVDMGSANLVAAGTARRYEAVPVGPLPGGQLLLAMADPGNVLAIDDLQLLTGRDLVVAVATRADVLTLISRLDRLSDAVEEASDEPRELDLDADDADGTLHRAQDAADDAPVVKLVNSIVAQAVELGASDIHFDRERDEMRVQTRVDGVLQHATTVPRRLIPGVVSRIKIMAELDIAERRVPQDGRITLRVEGREVDLRVVTLPLVHGESVVMRILDRSRAIRDLAELGLEDHVERDFRDAIARPYGAVLVTGPTGSGKSSTLYAALGAIRSRERSIVTIEDPVEAELDGVKQLSVNPRADVSFASALRSVLRADPDVIMVGEIRDRETAQIAIEAALTGHLVLSTLHTRDAASSITRLVDMGIEPFLLASSIDCVVAQRLARTLCETCREPVTLTVGELAANGWESDAPIDAHEARGCGRCGGTGHRGRTGIFEVLPLDEDLRRMVARGATADDLTAHALASGTFTRLRDDALRQVRLGRISIAEAARVTSLS